MKLSGNNTFIVLGIACFFLLIRNLFLLRSVQPLGYVINIYSNFSLSFYLSLITCYFIASILVIYNKKTLGFFILCFNHFEILLMPYMLGYYSMGRADDMSYIGEYLHIATSGHFSNWDIYPASHVIGSFISLISNIEAHQTSFIISILFSFIFICGINLFSREFVTDLSIRSLVLLSSFILYMGIYNFLNVPNGLFFSFTPFYLCYYCRSLKSNSVSLSIILILMTLLIPFTHPFIVFFLLSFFLFHKTYYFFSKSNANLYLAPNIKTPGILLASSFIGWFVYNTQLMKDLKISYLLYISKTLEPAFYSATDKLEKIHLGFFGYLKLLSLFYGRYIIPTVFIFISFIILIYNKSFLKDKLFKKYLYLVILYFVFLFLQLILLFNPLIVHQPDRLTNLNFTVYAQVPLFAFSLYLIFFKRATNLYKILQVCSVLGLVWSLSLFGCFSSPNICSPNVALTYNEVYGMKWFYSVKDTSNICVPMSQIYRFHDLFGNSSTPNEMILFPDHFGYTNNTGIFANMNTGKEKKFYTILLTIDELIYQEVPGYMNVGRYNNLDFVRFRNDDKVNKIYDSTNIEIFTSRMHFT